MSRRTGFAPNELLDHEPIWIATLIAVIQEEDREEARRRGIR